MPSGLKRYQTSGHDHFINFTCYHQHPYLDNAPARTVFEETLESIRQRHDLLIYAYVVMPNHVHLLLSEPKHHVLADTIRALKTQTSKKLKRTRTPFWQSRYFDRNIITGSPANKVASPSNRIGHGQRTRKPVFPTHDDKAVMNGPPKNLRVAHSRALLCA